jgi:hypothetical protein
MSIAAAQVHRVQSKSDYIHAELQRIHTDDFCRAGSFQFFHHFLRVLISFSGGYQVLSGDSFNMDNKIVSSGERRSVESRKGEVGWILPSAVTTSVLSASAQSSPMHSRSRSHSSANPTKSVSIDDTISEIALSDRVSKDKSSVLQNNDSINDENDAIERLAQQQHFEVGATFYARQTTERADGDGSSSIGSGPVLMPAYFLVPPPSDSEVTATLAALRTKDHVVCCEF